MDPSMNSFSNSLAPYNYNNSLPNNASQFLPSNNNSNNSMSAYNNMTYNSWPYPGPSWQIDPNLPQHLPLNCNSYSIPPMRQATQQASDSGFYDQFFTTPHFTPKTERIQTCQPFSSTPYMTSPQFMSTPQQFSNRRQYTGFYNSEEQSQKNFQYPLDSPVYYQNQFNDLTNFTPYARATNNNNYDLWSSNLQATSGAQQNFWGKTFKIPDVSQNRSEETKSCHNCGATSTPMWRRDSEGKCICNACGLYERANNGKKRPTKQIRKRRVPPPKNLNQICSNCSTRMTTMWRKTETGETVCNACGLYSKLYNKNRPIELRKEKLQVRSRQNKMKRVKGVRHNVDAQTIVSGGTNEVMQNFCYTNNSTPTHTYVPKRENLTDDVFVNRTSLIDMPILYDNFCT